MLLKTLLVVYIKEKFMYTAKIKPKTSKLYQILQIIRL